MTRQILFLCTGNYYRSRFAEELFNYLATEAGLNWRATSRALAIEKGSCNVGPISPHTRRALDLRGIRLSQPPRDPRGCTADDMAAADRIIALKEVEHRPYVVERHADFAHRVEYWHVHDLDHATADEAIPQIESLVRELMRSLGESDRAQAPDDS